MSQQSRGQTPDGEKQGAGGQAFPLRREDTSWFRQKKYSSVMRG